MSFPSLVLTNSRSIKNKIDEVHHCVTKLKPDLAVFCETWIDDETDNAFLEIPDYQILRKDRSQHGGGILTYCHQSLTIAKCSCPEVIEVNDLNTEFLWFFITSSDILVICLYHPNWGSSPYHSKAVNALVDIVTHSRESHSAKHLLICGDFNDLGLHVNSINSLLGTESLFDFPTRSNKQLDFVLCSRKSCFKKPRLSAPLGRSDHSVVFCPSENKPPEPKIIKIQFRKKSPSVCTAF